VLDKKKSKVADERNSRKAPLTDADARALLAQVSSVWVAKGKKVRELAASETSLDDLKGHTGNYRAPILRSGDRLLVGFHAGALARFLDG